MTKVLVALYPLRKAMLRISSSEQFKVGKIRRVLSALLSYNFIILETICCLPLLGCLKLLLLLFT